jgi:hypothetical protein
VKARVQFTARPALDGLRDAIVKRRPQNGWITSAWILDGWTAQPAYNEVRS